MSVSYVADTRNIVSVNIPPSRKIIGKGISFIKMFAEGIFKMENCYFIPVGNNMFRIEKYGFSELSDILCDFEKKFGFSTIEMFKLYVSGKLEHDEMDEWVSMFLLYLGAKEIKRYSCGE